MEIPTLRLDYDSERVLFSCQATGVLPFYPYCGREVEGEESRMRLIRPGPGPAGGGDARVWLA
jgi:hypothetical protein